MSAITDRTVMNTIFTEFRTSGADGNTFSWNAIDKALRAPNRAVNDIFGLFLNEFKSKGSAGTKFSWESIDKAVKEKKSSREVMLTFMNEYKKAGSAAKVSMSTKKIFEQLAKLN